MKIRVPLGSVQLILSVMSNSATLRIAALQASLSVTHSQSLLKLVPIESVLPLGTRIQIIIPL